MAEHITGINKVHAYAQVKKCFDAWLEVEGAEDYETRKAMQRMTDWLASNGQSDRIINIGSMTRAETHTKLPRDFAGYRQHGKNAEDANADVFYLSIPVYRDEIARDIGEERLESILTKSGWQRPRGKDNRKGHKALGLNIRFQIINGLTPPDD